MDVESLAKQLILQNMSPEQQNAVLESIKASLAQAKDVQKRKIGENVQVVVETLKKLEADIRARYDETGKAIEKRVASIKDGKDGKNGQDGRNGKDGKPGRDGAAGAKGQSGKDGFNGLDGENGISISDAHIDFDGSLIITLSDGKVLNVGEVVSQDIAEKINVISTMSTNGAVAVKEEGTTLTSGVKSINFVGAGITATTSGDDVTVTVSSGSGTVTSVAATVPAFLSVAGSPITTSGTLAISLSGTALPVANGGTGNATGTATINANLTGDVTSVGNASTLATVNSNVGAFTNANITVNAKGLITAAASGSPGGVTSVTGTSPVVSSGGTTPAISLAAGYGDTLNPYASKTANFVLAAPDGTAGVPTFRAVVATDIPTLNQSTTGSAATLTTGRTIAVTGDLAYTSPSFDGSANVTAAGTLATVNANVGSFTAANITVNAKGLITAAANGTAGGTVTSVAATVPAFLSVTGSPVTTSGTLAISLSGTALPVANGGTGVTTSTGSGNNVLSTSPTLTTPVISSITNTGTLTLPTSTDTLVGRATTDTLTNKTLTSPTLTTPNINSAQFATVSGTAPLYAARAWVNFNGTGTVAIRASGNVSSITDNGTGDYTVNFTTAMPDANFCTQYNAHADGSAAALGNAVTTSRNTSSVRVLSYAANGASNIDTQTSEAVIFR